MMKMHLIETDEFPFESLSAIAERESWRKEVHRPIYHVHKWWATRLGSVFRGILLGSVLPPGANLDSAFYSDNDFDSLVVWDPFMGSGTTVGEAHKLGMRALGRDINPVAAEAVRVALGPVSLSALNDMFARLESTIGREIRDMYSTVDSAGRPSDVLYWFWVMQAPCPECTHDVDLFSSWVLARNAYPSRKPEIQVICPDCRAVFQSVHGIERVTCTACHSTFDPSEAPARGAKAQCTNCSCLFSIIDALDGRRPNYRLVAKLLLTPDGTKEYLTASLDDEAAYSFSEQKLAELEASGSITLPTLELASGFNTKQAIRYGFTRWRDFFNARQLHALAKLRSAIAAEPDSAERDALLTLFSGVLEFNNLFASYKGEGTGAVRHMFSHHILKPERTPIEANVWGTSKSSGAFSTLYRSRLLRALGYRMAPKEVRVDMDDATTRHTARPMKPLLRPWPSDPQELPKNSVSISCGDSAKSELADESVDLVVTDPPFFDNVHYSELADFFYAWQQAGIHSPRSTRSSAEVQDTDAGAFTEKLAAVFRECARVLKPDGLLVFTYHHSRVDGWSAVAHAVLDAGLTVVNAHPVKAEMSVAMPKTQAKEPIQLDVIIVCRRAPTGSSQSISVETALATGFAKVRRLEKRGFTLSRNDVRVALSGQLLTTVRDSVEVSALNTTIERALERRDQLQTTNLFSGEVAS